MVSWGWSIREVRYVGVSEVGSIDYSSIYHIDKLLKANFVNIELSHVLYLDQTTQF